MYMYKYIHSCAASTELANSSTSIDSECDRCLQHLLNCTHALGQLIIEYVHDIKLVYT